MRFLPIVNQRLYCNWLLIRLFEFRDDIFIVSICQNTMDSSAKLRLLSDSLPQPKHKGVSEMFAPFLTGFRNNQFPHQIVLVFFASWFFWWVVHLDAYTLSDLFSDECGWLYESFLRTHLPSDMIAIHAGIGAVLINIAFLVLGKLGNKSDPYEGQVLLKESMLSLLLTLEVAVFFVIGF